MTYLIFSVIILIIFTVVWRLSSRRYVIPCPSYLAWMVEMDNPFAKENRSANIIGHLDLENAINDGILEKDKYDYILLVNMLGEIPKVQNALKESFNALKPGGILSITETIFDPHYQRISTLEKITSNLGFQKNEFFGKWYSYTAHFIAKKPEMTDV